MQEVNTGITNLKLIEMKKLKCKEYRYFDLTRDYEEVQCDREWYLVGFVSMARGSSGGLFGGHINSDIYAVVECPKERTLSRVEIGNIKMID